VENQEVNAITVAAAAERLNIGEKAVRQYANDGKLEKYFVDGKSGGHQKYLITVESIEKYQYDKIQKQNKVKEKPAGYQEKVPHDWINHAEKTYVRHLGTGKWSPNSDIKHNRAWWMRQYLEATETMADIPHIRAGRREARLILSEIKG
jgi:hypothetical protein